MLIDIILDFWGVGLAFVAFVVWMVRLEAKAMANSRELDYIKERRSEDLRSAKESREETAKLLDEIRNDIRETHRDIKDLLRRASVNAP